MSWISANVLAKKITRTIMTFREKQRLGITKTWGKTKKIRSGMYKLFINSNAYRIKSFSCHLTEKFKDWLNAKTFHVQ